MRWEQAILYENLIPVYHIKYSNFIILTKYLILKPHWSHVNQVIKQKVKYFMKHCFSFLRI